MKKSLTVLFIDDIKEDRQLFREILKTIDRNIKYIPSPDAEGALNYLSAAHTVPPDYIFLDAHMPDINGIECLQFIRKMTHLQHIPIILYSSHLSPAPKETAHLLGAKMCLAKPNQFDDACRAIASVMNMEYSKESQK
jgi:CheY-like chemotaxis protein